MNTNKLLIGVTAVAIVGVGAGAVVLATKGKKADTNTDTSSQVSSSASSSVQFKDGTYSAEGQYFSPAGLEKILVKVTLQSGSISNVEVTPKATDRESLQHQNEFASGIASKVVGKKISEVNVTKVSGSSLTSTGFKDALQKVQTQAKQN